MLQVSDGWYTASADVTVNIDDVNDNAPQFQQHFYQVCVGKNNNNNNYYYYYNHQRHHHHYHHNICTYSLHGSLFWPICCSLSIILMLLSSKNFICPITNTILVPYVPDVGVRVCWSWYSSSAGVSNWCWMCEFIVHYVQPGTSW